MKKDQIISIVNDFLINEIEIDETKINNDAHLKNDLGIDSLDFVDIVGYC
jgi:acyl carrier protein